MEGHSRKRQEESKTPRGWGGGWKEGGGGESAQGRERGEDKVASGTWAPLCWFLSLSQDPHGSASWGEGGGFSSDPVREPGVCMLHALGPLE